ncbi:DUF5050 domain-containing protein [Paenibacillus sp. N1-5-1-14]|uniref:DUF5050 domain-containing protein n=1 Tax=Paenibacillus radicibacter TaxID=2972488 RepID=UPI002159A3FA|nr:DUF5050 domain-containing protein [Paenibacillus radicibacter]MCR8643814.1 DUF5050 domain-containing protein [Paenibacillus radicibacter]
MKKKWTRSAAAFAICISLLAPTGISHAASTDVQVKLPNYKVTLNGHTVNNLNRKYPLIVYKDITYVPMTWYDSHLLGLNMKWSLEKGLDISKGQVSSSYATYPSESINTTSYTAEAPASTITINGQTIDNSKETYPLLSFRDVTYFPLTWRFAHDEFGWAYNWDNAEGLSIQSNNPQILTPELPAYKTDRDLAMYKGYYYFLETSGDVNQIYRAPLNDISKKESIYTYELRRDDDQSPSIHFHIIEGDLWFSYHLGSNLMGINHNVKVNDVGKGELQFSDGGYSEIIKTPYGIIINSLGPNSWDNNLSWLEPEHQNQPRKKIGDPKFIYGRYINDENPSFKVRDIGNSDTGQVIGDHLYIRATPQSALTNNSDRNQIYKLNLTTNKSEKIITSGVSQFRVIGENLYYVKDTDFALYTSKLDGSSERKLSENSVSWFDGVNGNLFYTTAIRNKEEKYHLYQVNESGVNKQLLKEKLDGVQLLNGKLICQLDAKEDYGTKVLDSSGNLILTLTDSISRLLPSDDAILFTTAGDSTIKVIR